jgi:hypothetical protein
MMTSSCRLSADALIASSSTYDEPGRVDSSVWIEDPWPGSGPLIADFRFRRVCDK